MARITAYEATDGSLHRDRKSWLRHESNILAAKELRAALTPDSVQKPEGVDEATHAANLERVYGYIVNSIGLNKLRELLAIQFKPSAEESDDAPAQSADNAGGDVAGSDGI